MKLSWTKGLPKKIVEEVRGNFLKSLQTRKRLIVLLEGKINTSRTTALNKEGYDTANWAYKQADLIGYERALKEVIDLIT